MTLWMVWAVCVSGLLGLGAVLVERLLSANRVAGRWAWIAAIGVTVALQVGSLTGWRRSANGVADAGGVIAVLRVMPSTLTEGLGAATRAAPAWIHRLDPWLVGVWVLSSSLLAMGLVGGLLRLRREARRWPRRTVCGQQVLLSKDFGPALVGLLRPSIVLPRSMLRLDPGAVHIACVHEASHRAARDPLVLLVGVVLVLLTPWNVALWWMAARLRQAVELDCDRRVIDAGVDRAEYGRLLLSLGSGGGYAVTSPTPAFAKPVSLLERRLTMMTNGVRIGGVPGGVAAVTVMTLLVAVACGVDAPTVAADPQPEPPAAVEGPTVDVSEMVSRAARAGTPLFYVDGVRVAGDAAEAVQGLDPDDIESIEVIKGPAATDVFGEEASGGVIQIHTKAAS